MRFVDEFMKDRNATQAAQRAGYSPKTAHAQGHRLIKDAEIQKMLAEKSATVAAKAEFEAVDVLRQWVLIATADPTKISRVRHTNCRHCWGENHGYQWHEREFAEALEKHSKDPEGWPMPDPVGGFGWAHNRPPHPDCPDCKGEGHTETYFEDMSKLGDAERRLIAAVKKTKDGIEVKMRNQDEAVLQIAKYLGMLVDKHEVKSKSVVAVAEIPADVVGDTDALAALYSKIVGG